MKLLIYSHYFAPSVGGVETIVLSLARGLAGLRESSGGNEFKINLVTQTPRENFDDDAQPFGIVRRPSLLHLWSLIRDSDVVHIAGPALVPLTLALLSRKPVVLEHHGFQTICPNGQLLIEASASPCPGHFMAGRHGECFKCNQKMGWIASCKLWLLTYVRRFLCRRVTTNVTPTAWLGTLLNLPRIQPIPHGIGYIPANLQRAKTAGSTPLVVFQGRLVTTKGVRVLLGAARILISQNRPLDVLLIGDGPERRVLEQSSQEGVLNGHVRFAGRLASEQLEAALSEASLVVVPSLGGEVFGLVVVENMLRGLPVIASDLGAFLEVVEQGGLSFRTGDPEALAKEIERLLDNPGFAEDLARRGRQRALAFCDFDRMVEFHAQAYKKAIS